MPHVACLLVILSVAGAPASIPNGVDRQQLERLLDSTVQGWRFRLGEAPGAEAADFDDSDWEQVEVGYRWYPHDSTCWFRTRITIPESINEVPVTGSTVRLKLGVDNEAKVYVNGEFRQQFTWADGDVVLAENARRGETVTVAVYGINRPGYGSLYRAFLVSSACEEMVEAVRGLLQEFECIEADAPFLSADRARQWNVRIDSAISQLDLQAYHSAQKTRFLASEERARQMLLGDAKNFERSLRQVEQQLQKIELLLAEGQRSGLQLAYPRVGARVLESFLQYARDDMNDGVSGHRVRAAKIADYLQQLGDDTLEILHATRTDHALDLRVPEYHAGTVSVREGTFWQDDHPVFFTGVGHFSQVRRDIPILGDYGLNIIQIETGPNRVLPDPATVDEQVIRDDVLRYLDLAAEHHVAVNLLISPHYFPQWAIDRNPKLAECGLGFIKYCIEAPESRAIHERFLRTLMPIIANHPALHSICLSNEPQYRGRCEYSLKMYRDWLERKYGKIEAVNKLYGTDYRSIDAVAIPEDVGDYAAYFDWCRFNQDRFLEFHRFLAALIHEYDPDIPIHAKVMSQAFREPDHFEAGIDHEDFNQLGAISGNDCWQFYADDDRPEYSQGWIETAMNYTLQHCTAVDNPIFNSEDHVIMDRNWRYVPASHIRTAYWVQALHGQGAATTWVWERGQEGDLGENILTRPNCVWALGTIALDLNRLAREVHALQRARAEMAMLYSESSLLPTQNHVREAISAYQGAYFSDALCDFVTEHQAASGKLNAYKLVLVPRAAHAPEAVVAAFQDYIATGGSVMTVGDCFTHDEYGRPRAKSLHPTGPGRLAAYPEPLSPRAYREILDGSLDTTGCSRPFRISGAHGEPLWGVNLRWAELDRDALISLVNFGWNDQTVQLKGRKPIGTALDLLTNNRVKFPLTLAPLEPVLLRVSVVESGR
ncbi:MAG: beta-galactosidase [Candidatus Hydrogenedentes bacterium]|nr:beta-galactosidase [Candidatus Hydrogenedentota bacterium]